MTNDSQKLSSMVSHH